MLLEIISWNCVSCFNGGGGGVFFRWGGSFLSGGGGRGGGVPMGGISFGGRKGFEKIVRWGLPPMFPLWENL